MNFRRSATTPRYTIPSVTCSMCMPVKVKKVEGNCGTLFATLENSALTSCPGTAGNIGSVRPSAISLLHSIPWRITNPAPHAIVASSHSVWAFALRSTEARTAITMVSELVSKNAVITVALTMLSEWNGVGQPAVERSEEHTSELQSHSDLVCRLLLE